MPFIQMEGTWEDFGGPAGGGAGGQGPQGRLALRRVIRGWCFSCAFKNPEAWLAGPSWDAFLAFSVGRERGIKKRKYHFLNY